MNRKTIEIPIGISTINEQIVIPFPSPHRNHCSITGFSGAGKTTLVRAMLDYITKNYDGSQVTVWTCFSKHSIDELRQYSNPELYSLITNSNDSVDIIIEQLYKETQKRVRVLSEESATSYHQIRSLPLLIVVIDELQPFDHSEQIHHSIERMIEDILRMSHATGISLICSSQVPITMFDDSIGSMANLFNIRIALRAPLDLIYESLSVDPSNISQNDKKAIERLTCGKPGEFAFYNRYGHERILFGRVGL